MVSNTQMGAPPAALCPDFAADARIQDWLTRHLAMALERVEAGPVVPDLDMAQFRAELAAIDFSEPRPPEALLAWILRQLEHGTVHMTHPRYFGLFNPAPVAPAQWADRIAGAFNPQLASTGSSPAPVEIEAHVIRAIARRAGLPAESGGALHHQWLRGKLYRPDLCTDAPEPRPSVRSVCERIRERWLSTLRWNATRHGRKLLISPASAVLRYDSWPRMAWDEWTPALWNRPCRSTERTG
jgi:hypothetical protein